MATPQKRTRLILCFAFIMSTVIDCGLVLMLTGQTSFATSPLTAPANIQIACYAIAAVGLLASLYWAHAKMSATTSAQRFLMNTILALAMAEVSVIAGLLLFFIARKTAEFWPFAILTLLVQTLFILPRAIRRD